MIAAILWGALLSVSLADEPTPDAEPETVTSRATDALQDAATLRPRVVRWRQQLQPRYPEAERAHAWPAQHCRCVFTLGADGVPKRVEVTECAAPFQAAATQALMDWRTFPLEVDAEGDVVMALVQVDFAVPGAPVSDAPSTSSPAVPRAAAASARTPPASAESEDARLARVRAEADSLARAIASDKAAFEAQVIESDWYGRERVAVLSWILAQDTASRAPNQASLPILLPADRAEVASRLGTSVGVLQRVLRLADTLGGITLHGDVVVVRDAATLERLSVPSDAR